MGRKEQRAKKKLEKNPIRELNKIQNKYYIFHWGCYQSMRYWQVCLVVEKHIVCYIFHHNLLELRIIFRFLY